MTERQKQTKPLFYKHRPDYMISILVCLLIGIGLVMIYSIGWITVLKQTAGSSDNNTFFYGQLISLVLGLIGWFVAAKIHYSFWQKYASYFFWGAVILMFLVLVPGVAVNSGGATRWVRFGFINFQPVEFLKLGTVLYMGAWLVKNKKNLNKPIEGLLPFLIIIGLIALTVVVLQKDMGSAMVIICTMLSMYYVSGAAWWNVGLATGILAGGGAVLAIAAPYRVARLMTFLNHTQDDAGSGYHIQQALIAIGSGGLLGRGLGKSLQAYGYLPESTNDSVFAIIAEEFGFIGASAVIIIFGLLVWRGIRISRRAADDYGKFVAIGISCWIGFQALINIGAMLNLIPLTGITLPFISYGGTSLIALLAGVGILQNISKYTYKEVYDEDTRRRRGDRRTYLAGSGRRSRVSS